MSAERPTSNFRLLADLREQLVSQVRGMWRYRWRAIALMWIVSIVGWVGVYSLPPVYSASTRVLIDTENAIRPLLEGIASSSNVISEVNMVSREMKSRPNLAEVARATDLHLRSETDAEFAQLLENLRKQVHVKGTRDYVFTISYADRDRDTAVAVVESLLNTFVEKSLGGDRQDSSDAQSFLREQINQYEARLTRAEDKLANFKRDNVAMMPDQRGDYFARLQAAEAARRDASRRLRLAQGRRAELLRQLEGEEPVFGIMPGSELGTSSDGFAAAKIREFEAQLAELRLEYTDKHPRIGQILDTIRLLEEQQEEERAAVAAGGARTGPVVGNPLDINPVYQNMRIQLTNTEVEIASLQSELGQQQKAVADLKLLVDTVPQVEAELGRLNRDYRVVRQKHEQLLAQLEKANLGEDVEQSIDNVRFRIIEPPFADRKPTGPKRQLLIVAILFGAVALGGAVAFLLNLLNPVFFSGREVTSVTGLPVLGSVSFFISPDEAKGKRKEYRRFSMAIILLVLSFTIVSGFAEKLSPFVRSIAGMVV